MDEYGFITTASYDPLTYTCTTNKVNVGDYVVESQNKIKDLENEICDLKYELNKLKFEIYNLASESNKRIKKALDNMTTEYVRKAIEV